MEPVRKCLSFSDVSEATIPLTPANIWLVSGLVFAAGSSGRAPVNLLVLLGDPVMIQTQTTACPLFIGFSMAQTGPGAQVNAVEPLVGPERPAGLEEGEEV